MRQISAFGCRNGVTAERRLNGSWNGVGHGEFSFQVMKRSPRRTIPTRAAHGSGGVLHVVGGRGGSLRLQPVKIIGGLLRVAGGGKDRPLVVFQNFQP